MGYALIWAESLAAALIGVALATSWSARGRSLRLIWAFVVFLGIGFSAAAIATIIYSVQVEVARDIWTSWSLYSFTWLVAFLIFGFSVVRRGLRRPAVDETRSAASWCRWRLWFGFAGALFALAFTFWNCDLAVRVDLATVMPEASATLEAISPATVADADNAARVYLQAANELGDEKSPWPETSAREADRQNDWKDPLELKLLRADDDWKAPSVADYLKRYEKPLMLLRKAGAMKRCNFDQPRTILDAMYPPPDKSLRQVTHSGLRLLAIDARFKAAEGDLRSAFDDINAMLGMIRHFSIRFGLMTGIEIMAWVALEDVLRLAPPSKDAIPALALDDLIPLVRKTREQNALHGMIFPSIALQPSGLTDDLRKKNNGWKVFVVENAFIPLARVFFIPDDLEEMHKLIDGYQKSPESWRAETPKDWASLRESTHSDPASILSAYYIKPKQKKLLQSALFVAALRQNSLTGLAIESFHRKHGKYPERLEELVPEYFASVPVDVRDGQPLRIKRLPDSLIVYTSQDSATVEGGNSKASWQSPVAVFQLKVPKANEKPAVDTDKKSKGD